MNEINTFTSHKRNSFDGAIQSQNNHHTGSSFIKHQLHEKKIDEFFWTDLEAPSKRFSPFALFGAIAGVLTPVLILAKKHNPKAEFNSLENIYKATNFHYELPEILKVGCGGVLGGLIGGLLDRKERGKIEKLEEASFQLMNVVFPAVLVAGGVKLCEQVKTLNKSFPKLVASAIGMFIGVNLAVKGANKLDDIYFDRHDIEADRKFKKRDMIVHVDDLVGALILAKIPMAEKIHPEKLIPLIYAWSGFHVGEK